MNEIESHVLDIIGENSDSPDVFTEDNIDPIRDSINDAIEEISILQGINKKKYYLPLKASRNFYRLDLNIAWVDSVWLYGIGRKLDQKSFTWLIDFNPRWMYNAGSPEFYCQVGDNVICVHPAPSDDVDTLEINAVVAHKRYTTDTDKIQLRENTKWAVVHYAVGEFYAGRGDAKTAVYHHNQYLNRLGIQGLMPELGDKIWHHRTYKN